MSKDLTYGYASHQGPLGIALCVTKGPVLELGTGLSSTPMLHSACLNGRYLLSVDEDFGYINRFKSYENDKGLESKEQYHYFRHVVNYDRFFETVGLDWSVVLVDCELPKSVRSSGYLTRQGLVGKFRDSRDFEGILVVHDTESKEFNDELLWDFKHKWTFKPSGLPWTTMASHKIDFLNLIGLGN